MSWLRPWFCTSLLWIVSLGLSIPVLASGVHGCLIQDCYRLFFSQQTSSSVGRERMQHFYAGGSSSSPSTPESYPLKIADQRQPLVSSPEVIYLKPVEVTATRVPITRPPAPESLIIDGAQLRLRQYKTLAEALASLAGVYVSQTGGLGGQASVFIRGSESDHVLVIVDGVRVNDPSSPSFDAISIVLGDVGKITLLRGAHDLKYGNDAIGGIIKIDTIGPLREVSTPQTVASIYASTGSRDSLEVRGRLEVEHPGKRWDVRFSHFATDGQSATSARLRGMGSKERDGYHNTLAKVSYMCRLSVHDTLGVHLGYQRTYSAYDLNQFDASRFITGEANGRARRARRWDGRLFINSRINEDWMSEFSLAATHHRRKEITPNAGEGLGYEGELQEIKWHHRINLSPRWGLEGGVEGKNESAEAENSGADYARSENVGAAFIQVYTQPSENLWLSVGWRGHAQNGAIYSTGSLRLQHILKDWLTLHLATFTRFKTSSLGDRFQDFPAFNFFSNPDLRPEKSETYEVGFSVLQDSWSWKSVLFSTRIQDIITLGSRPQGGTTLFNLTSSSIRGIESEVYGRMGNLDILWSLGSLRTRGSDGMRLLRRPSLQSVLRVAFNTGESQAEISLVSVGKQDDIDRVDASRVRNAGYSLLNFAFKKKLAMLGEEAHWQLSVDNILDKAYEPVSGYAGQRLSVTLGVGFEI